MLNKKVRWLKKAALLITAVKIALIALILFMPTGTSAIIDRDGEPVPNSIAVLEKVEIGGIDQWILIRGESLDNPLLLYLHGGPGNPEMSLASLTCQTLEQSFTVVHWDQRGAGKTFSPFIPKDSMNIDQFVADTRDLTLYLRERTGQKDIYLLGHSWGALIGLKAVAVYPELYTAYIGMGQFTDANINEQYAYSFVMEEAIKRGDQSTVTALSTMGAPPYSQLRELGILKSKVTHYGGSFYGKSSGFSTFIKNMIRAREYAPLDYLRFIAGSYFSGILMNEVMQTDMFEDVPEVSVPVYFLSGEYDYMTCMERVDEYFQFIKAPFKEHIHFQASAHNPIYEEPERFAQELNRIKNQSSGEE